MQNRKEDLRITRTYKSLTEAFTSLMSEKAFEEITINDLCNRAMIRRTTFYKHFSDKYDFFRFFLINVMEHMDTHEDVILTRQELNDFCIRICRLTLSYFQNHEKLVKNIKDSNLYPIMLNIYFEQCVTDFTAKLKVCIKQGLQLPASPEVTASFFSGAVLIPIGMWLKDSKSISQEQLITELENILNSWDL